MRTRVDQTLARLLDIALGSDGVLQIRDTLGRRDSDAELELGRTLDGTASCQQCHRGRSPRTRGAAESLLAVGVKTYRVISEPEEEDEASAMTGRCLSRREGGYVSEEKNVGEGQSDSAAAPGDDVARWGTPLCTWHPPHRPTGKARRGQPAQYLNERFVCDPTNAICRRPSVSSG